jgi:hypothetical protein
VRELSNAAWLLKTTARRCICRCCFSVSELLVGKQPHAVRSHVWQSQSRLGARQSSGMTCFCCRLSVDKARLERYQHFGNTIVKHFGDMQTRHRRSCCLMIQRSCLAGGASCARLSFSLGFACAWSGHEMLRKVAHIYFAVLHCFGPRELVPICIGVRQKPRCVAHRTLTCMAACLSHAQTTWLSVR